MTTSTTAFPTWETTLIANEAAEGAHQLLRLGLSDTYKPGLPGQYVQLYSNASSTPETRAYILRSSVQQGWMECLLQTPISWPAGANAVLNISAALGEHFQTDRRRALLIGAELGIAAIIGLAESLRDAPELPFVCLGTASRFPFRPIPSKLLTPSVPDGVIGSVALLDDWGIASRLASHQGQPGCFDGDVATLSALWLENQQTADRAGTSIYACGPQQLLKQISELAEKYAMPLQCIEVPVDPA